MKYTYVNIDYTRSGKDTKKNRHSVLWPDNICERAFDHRSVAFNRWKMNKKYTTIYTRWHANKLTEQNSKWQVTDACDL